MPAIDAAIHELDSVNRSSISRQVNHVAAVAFTKLRPDVRSKCFMIAKGHDHLANFDRRISDFDTQLPERAGSPLDLEAIAIIVKIYLLLTQQLPLTASLSRFPDAGEKECA